jgi:hypothetical protein
MEAAIGAGVVVGLFLAHSASVFPMGILGLFVSLAVGGVGCAVLCVLAPNYHLAVGLGYAASMGMTFVIASRWEGWTAAARQFTSVFFFAGIPALLVSFFCAYLKWAELWDDD